MEMARTSFRFFLLFLFSVFRPEFRQRIFSFASAAGRRTPAPRRRRRWAAKKKINGTQKRRFIELDAAQ